MVMADFLKSNVIKVVELYPNEAEDLVKFDEAMGEKIIVEENYHLGRYPQVGATQQEGRYGLLLDKEGVIAVAARQKGEILGYALAVRCKSFKADTFPAKDMNDFRKAICVTLLGLDSELSHLELIINDLKNRLDADRYQRLVINVPEDNLPLLKRLKTMGFTATALVPDYYGNLDSIFMEY